MRALACLLATATFAVFLASCGGDDGPDPASGTPIRSPETTGGRPTPAITHELLAEANAFDQETLMAEPGELIVLLFRSEDAAPHNFALYATPEAGEEIFVGETIQGPEAVIIYEFEAPAAGEYFFRCDVHPIDMTGELIVD